MLRIGGEHEDYYDPDFYIYNDMFLLSGEEGDRDVAIYGYPESTFPPTDFHTATLHGHRAELSEDGSELHLRGREVWTGEVHRENHDDFSLEIESGRWTKLTQRSWQQWSLQRIDGENLHAFELRNAATMLERTELTAWALESGPELADFFDPKRIVEAVGCVFDADLLTTLFTPPESLSLDAESETVGFELARVQYEGVTIRYLDEDEEIQIRIDGELSEARARVVCEDLTKKLSALHAIKCELRFDCGSASA